MQTRKTRHQFYLPDELSARLDAMAAQPGSSKTAILTDALTAATSWTSGSEPGSIAKTGSPTEPNRSWTTSPKRSGCSSGTS